jgi:hypothetical protein
LQGTISSVHHLSKQADEDFKKYEEMLQEKRKKMLRKMAEENMDDITYCPCVHTHMIGHNPVSCYYCQSRVCKLVRGPRGGTSKGEITRFDFVQDYYNRYDVIRMLEILRHCMCCCNHQIEMSYYRRIVPFEKSFTTFLEYASNDEIELIETRQIKEGTILPSFQVYPNTREQSKLPTHFHRKCKCECVYYINFLVETMEELEHYRSYPKHKYWGSPVYFDETLKHHCYEDYDSDIDVELNEQLQYHKNDEAYFLAEDVELND